MIKILLNFVKYLFFIRNTTWYSELTKVCEKLHLPSLIHSIEVGLFRTTFLWETGVSKYLSNTKGNLFIDVGAYHGRYSILLGNKYNKIITIEPESENANILKNNLKVAGLNNVKVVQCAISDKNGYTNLYIGKSEDWPSIIHGKNNSSIKVKTQTIESIVNDKIVDLIKVDVEGAELLVLNGSINVMNQIKSWVIEVHKPNNPKEIEHMLLKNGYSTSWLDARHIYASKKI